jgi:hypothetical protein
MCLLSTTITKKLNLATESYLHEWEWSEDTLVTARRQELDTSRQLYFSSPISSLRSPFYSIFPQQRRLKREAIRSSPWIWGIRNLHSTCSGPGWRSRYSDYGLDGPGIESRWGRDFPHPSRSALGPPSLLHNGYRVSFPGIKQPGRGFYHPPGLKKE